MSEGFIRAGYNSVAHVEMNQAACYTLKTRMAYHWLVKHGQGGKYNVYLHGNMSRYELYDLVPDDVVNSVINAEINQESLSDIFNRIDSLLDGSKLDLIVGGPPCQAYSLVGRSRDKKSMKGDKRNYLYIYYAEFLKRYKPYWFVFENVTGLLTAKDQDGELYLNKMRSLFRKAGYETEFMILTAEDYGVLQTRQRVILVGKRGKESGFYPEPEKWSPRVKVNELFSDLPSIKSGEGFSGPSKTKSYKGAYMHKAGILNNGFAVTWHQARPHTEQDLEIYRLAVELWNKKKERLNYNSLPERLKTHRHRNSFLDRFKVVAGDLERSHTVVAHISKDGHHYIHPDINQNRSLTPREAARLQSFPDDYYFESTTGVPQKTPVFNQIGNAVPVLMAQKIAEKLKEIW